MNQHVNLADYAAITEPRSLTFERSLDASVEKVWAYLTQSDLRRQWLAAGDMDLTKGAAFELIWRNDELSNAPTQPAGGSSEMRMESAITAIEPQRLLSFNWANTGDVTFRLKAMEQGTILTVEHLALPDHDTLLKIAAGWHAHLDILAARIEGAQYQPFWDGWRRLKAEYEQRLPA